HGPRFGGCKKGDEPLSCAREGSVPIFASAYFRSWAQREIAALSLGLALFRHWAYFWYLSAEGEPPLDPPVPPVPPVPPIPPVAPPSAPPSPPSCLVRSDSGFALAGAAMCCGWPTLANSTDTERLPPFRPRRDACAFSGTSHWRL